MKENICYCVYCGTENKSANKKCTKCKKKLHLKKHEVLDYFYERIKEDIKGEGVERFFSILEAIVRHFWYGTVITLTVVVGVITAVATPRYENETVEKPVFTPISEQQRLLGCWKGETSYSTHYYKFIDTEMVDYYSLEGDYQIRVLFPYYIDVKVADGRLRHFFGIGAVPPDEISGLDLVWISDDEWHGNSDDYIVETNTRISCEEFDETMKDIPYTNDYS